MGFTKKTAEQNKDIEKIIKEGIEKNKKKIILLLGTEEKGDMDYYNFGGQTMTIINSIFFKIIEKYPDLSDDRRQRFLGNIKNKVKNIKVKGK